MYIVLAARGSQLCHDAVDDGIRTWQTWHCDSCNSSLSGARHQELTDALSDFLHMGFEREVASIEELHLRVRVIALEGFRSRREEEGIVFSPDGQESRLVRPEVFLELGI